ARRARTRLGTKPRDDRSFRDWGSLAARQLTRARHLLARDVRSGRDALYPELEFVDVRRPAQRFFVRDVATLVEGEHGLVERLHAVLRGPLSDGAVDQVGLFLLEDAVAQEGGRDEHFDGRHASPGVAARDQ